MSLIGRGYAMFLGMILPLMGCRITIGTGASIHPLSVIEPGQGHIVIGPRCVIHRGAMLLAYKGTIILGANVSVNPYTILYGHGGLEIGDDVRIAAHTVIIPADHIYADKNQIITAQGESCRGIKIGRDVWIGANVTVLDGVSIADGCVIGAGGVVKSSTEPYGVYAGVPARKIKDR